MFRNQHITSCSLLVVEVHLLLPLFTNYSVTTKGPWLEQYSCPFSWLVELVNKANCYTLWAGQMNQILSCDWLPERARWSPILSSRDCSQYPCRKKISSNPLLTKLVGVEVAGYWAREKELGQIKRGGTGTVAWLPPATGFTREAWPYIYLCVITTM